MTRACLTLGIAALAAVAGPASGGDVVIAPVSSVEVHEDGARITRRCTLDLPQGRSTLEVDLHELGPDPLDPGALETISATARGENRVVTLRLDERNRSAPAERLAELESAVRAARDSVRTARRLERNALADLELIEALGRGLLEEARTAEGQADLDRFEERMAWISARRLGVLEVLGTAEEVARAGRDELAAREAALLEAERGPRLATVILELEGPGGRESIDVTWLDARAGWSPELTIRADQASGSAEVEVHANVLNGTGTDWRDVDLTLSTGRLRGDEPRAVESIEIDVLEDDADPEVATPSIPTAPVSLTIDDLPAPVTLPRGEGRLLVQRFRSRCLLEAIMRPVLRDGAWSRGTVLNSSGRVLLPCATALYLDDEFVGMPRLERTVAPGESFAVWFGELDGLAIEREVLERETVTTGLLGGGRLTRTAFRITITNERPDGLNLVVEDRMPTSGSDDIEVSIRSVSPPLSNEPGYLEGARERGILRWAIAIPGRNAEGAPGSATIEWTVNVSHSAEVETTPIPR